MPIKSKGAVFEVANAGTDVDAAAGFTAVVSNLTDIQMPESELDKISTLSHDTAGNGKTYISGLEEPGTAEVTGHFDKTKFASMTALVGVEKVYRVRFSDGSGRGWTGFLQPPTEEIDLEGLQLMTAKCEVSGVTEPFSALAGA